jgi:hypothetical protein
MQISVGVARVTPRGILEVEGWAAGLERVRKIEILVGDQALGAPLTGVERPDVLAAYPQYADAGRSGYVFRTELSDDLLRYRQVQVRVEAESGVASAGREIDMPPEINREAPSDATVLFNFDELSVEPGGAIRFSGWAASPQNITKINALLDLEFIGEVTYGFARPDVGNAYPTIPSARNSGLSFQTKAKKQLGGQHSITLLIQTQTGAVYTPSVQISVAQPAGNVDDATRLSRLTSPMKGRPSWRSGFELLQGGDGALATDWPCAPKIDERLRKQVLEAAQIEPAINADLLLRVGLHGSSGHIREEESAYIAAVRSCARCHCLVVSESKLGEAQIDCLFAMGREFVTSVRPWLTLLSVGAPAIRYWHRHNGLRREIGYTPPDAGAATGFAVSVVTAAMADHLVVTADPLGVAMMRQYGPRIFATTPKVSLLAAEISLDAEDVAFFREFIAMNLNGFHALIAGSEFLRALNIDAAGAHPSFAPRIVVVDGKGQEPAAV